MITAPKRPLLHYDHEQIRLSFTLVAREHVVFGVYESCECTHYHIPSYLHSQPMITAPKRPLLHYDHEQIRLSFTPVAREHVDFGVYDINDRNWYYVMITWSKTTGEMQVFVNAVMLTTIDLYARGDDLPA